MTWTKEKEGLLREAEAAVQKLHEERAAFMRETRARLESFCDATIKYHSLNISQIVGFIHANRDSIITILTDGINPPSDDDIPF